MSFESSSVELADQAINTSGSTSKKHSDFICEPMGEKDVTSCPGIGPVTGKKLAAIGVNKAYVLLGQFLILKKDEELFTEWLKTNCGANPHHAKCCYEALNEWCNSFI